MLALPIFTLQRTRSISLSYQLSIIPRLSPITKQRRERTSQSLLLYLLDTDTYLDLSSHSAITSGFSLQTLNITLSLLSSRKHTITLPGIRASNSKQDTTTTTTTLSKITITRHHQAPNLSPQHATEPTAYGRPSGYGKQ